MSKLRRRSISEILFDSSRHQENIIKMENRRFDILNCQKDDVILMDNRTCLIGDLQNALDIRCNQNKPWTNQIHEKIAEQIVQEHLLNIKDKHLVYKIFWDEGKECQILKVGAPSWSKGRLRVTLQVEFAPDEPEIPEVVTTNNNESPLDDLRRTINHMS